MPAIKKHNSLQDYKSKVKRQIAILSYCLKEKEEICATVDLAEIFNVEEITIKRDLQDLRSLGIQIHAVHKKGVIIDDTINEVLLKDIILKYIGLSYTEQSLDRSTGLLVKRYGYQALLFIVDLQYCIDNCFEANIDYNISSDKIDKNITLKPMLIFQNEGCWRILAENKNILKQYRLDKIKKVKITENKFTKTKYSIPELFQYTWKSWIGPDIYKIKLHFNKDWADKILPRMFIPSQKIIINDDGSIIFEAEVNSLEEVASWIVSRGKGCKVIEPIELKELVISLAKGVLINYQNDLIP